MEAKIAYELKNKRTGREEGIQKGEESNDKNIGH